MAMAGTLPGRTQGLGLITESLLKELQMDRVAGGFVIVIFFSFWAKTFGRAQLGRIQGTAQMMTVLASAIGPLLLAKCHAWTGSYASVFYSFVFMKRST
jgi:hypothetical protein